MFGLVFLGFTIALVFVTMGVLFRSIKKAEPLFEFAGVACFIVGSLLLYGFADTSRFVLNTGSPVTKIAPGTYKVGFVYQAGENVSVGIERSEKRPRYAVEKTEQLFLYQFPAKDFESEIRVSAKKLVATKLITGEGTFNRYKLE